MRIRMDIKGWRGDYYARTKNFNSDKHYANYVGYILTHFGEKVTGERRVDPEGMYLALINQYKTVANLARAYGISEDYAREQIQKGKSINLSK